MMPRSACGKIRNMLLLVLGLIGLYYGAEFLATLIQNSPHSKALLYSNLDDDHPIFTIKRMKMNLSMYSLLSETESEDLGTQVFEEVKGSFPNYPVIRKDLIKELGAFEIGTKLESVTKTQINCVQKPRFPDILFSNNHWQVLSTSLPSKRNISSTMFYIYNAYLDTRSKNGAVVHILGLSDQDVETDKVMDKPRFCQFWYPNSTRVEIEKVVGVKTPWIWGTQLQNTEYFPYLFTCKLPTRIQENNLLVEVEEEIPESVSLVMKKCDMATNQVKVVYNPVDEENRHEIGICFKMLDFPAFDISRRIIEMVELLKILGAGGIHFPILSIHPQTMKILKYYESTGFVTLKQFVLPGPQNNMAFSRHIYLRNYHPAKSKQELIPYNDCLLSNIYRFRYIGILDLDEVLLPTYHANYLELFEYIKSTLSKLESYCFDMKLFVDTMLFNEEKVVVSVSRSIPVQQSDPEITNHVYFDKEAVCDNHVRNHKCFHSTHMILLVHSHYCMANVDNQPCMDKQIFNDVAYVHHHRKISSSCKYNASTDSEELILNPFGYDGRISQFKFNLSASRDKITKIIREQVSSSAKIFNHSIMMLECWFLLLLFLLLLTD